MLPGCETGEVGVLGLAGELLPPPPPVEGDGVGFGDEPPPPPPLGVGLGEGDGLGLGDGDGLGLGEGDGEDHTPDIAPAVIALIVAILAPGSLPPVPVPLSGLEFPNVKPPFAGSMNCIVELDDKNVLFAGYEAVGKEIGENELFITALPMKDFVPNCAFIVALPSPKPLPLNP